MGILRKVDFVSSNVECCIKISFTTLSLSCCKSLKNLAAAWLILGFELFWIRFFSLHACLFGIWNSSSLFFSDKTGFGGRISFGSVLIESSKIYYIKMKVCVCVCMYVCPAACRRTHTSHHSKIWHGLLISPHLATPNVDPRGTPYSDPIWKILRVKNWVGASKQNLLLEVGLPCKILFVVGSPKPGARRVHPNKWGCMLW
jgi:hypothetical protein